uniref:Uncharacterized protein n=1 Tax=Arundo donax TaxID=35708 RepID=A0A0A9TF17_ARUDO
MIQQQQKTRARFYSNAFHGR